MAKAAFPKGNPYLTIRDELGTIYTDKDFKALFPLEGHRAIALVRLPCEAGLLQELFAGWTLEAGTAIALVVGCAVDTHGRQLICQIMRLPTAVLEAIAHTNKTRQPSPSKKTKISILLFGKFVSPNLR